MYDTENVAKPWAVRAFWFPKKNRRLYVLTALRFQPVGFCVQLMASVSSLA